MLADCVDGSLQYQFGFVLVSVLKVVILDSEVDKPLPKFNLRAIVSDGLLKSRLTSSIRNLLFLGKLDSTLPRDVWSRTCKGYSILLDIVVVEGILLCDLLDH